MGIVPSSPNERGKRVSFWLGEKDFWLEEMLEKRVQMTEARGIQSSIGDQIRLILRKELREDFEVEYGKDTDSPDSA